MFQYNFLLYVSDFVWQRVYYMFHVAFSGPIHCSEVWPSYFTCVVFLCFLNSVNYCTCTIIFVFMFKYILVEDGSHSVMVVTWILKNMRVNGFANISNHMYMVFKNHWCKGCWQNVYWFVIYNYIRAITSVWIYFGRRWLTLWWWIHEFWNHIYIYGFLKSLMQRLSTECLSVCYIPLLYPRITFINKLRLFMCDS